jgi:hypothetical protein
MSTTTPTAPIAPTNTFQQPLSALPLVTVSELLLIAFASPLSTT